VEWRTCEHMQKTPTKGIGISPGQPREFDGEGPGRTRKQSPSLSSDMQDTYANLIFCTIPEYSEISTVPYRAYVLRLHAHTTIAHTATCCYFFLGQTSRNIQRGPFLPYRTPNASETPLGAFPGVIPMPYSHLAPARVVELACHVMCFE